MNLLRTDTAVVCHKGCVRGNNEDNFFLNGDYMPLEDMDRGVTITQRFTEDGQLFAVLDGMGGTQLGERASWIAAGMLSGIWMEIRTQDPEICMKRIIPEINAKIQEDCRAHDEDYEGTTIAAIAFSNRTAYVFNIGDSRVYRFHDDTLKQLTEDHSSVWEKYRDGQMTMEQARRSPENNMITRYLGMDESDIPEQWMDCQQLSLQEGDRYILCSDGISDMYSFDRFAGLVRNTRGLEPVQCAYELVRVALEEGGKDNMTCMVVDITGSSAD